MAQKTHRDRVIEEILSSETSYNTCLEKVQQFVTAPLKAEIASNELEFESPEIIKLFDILSQVIMVSNTLKDELSQYFEPNGQSLVKSLENFPRLIIIYFDYIRAYHSSIPHLRASRQPGTPAARFFASCEEQLGGQIETFLITPIQRPPRYLLLFQELLKNTPPESPDFQPLTNAVSKIIEEVAKLDTAIGEFEEASAMAELGSRFGSAFEVFVLHRRLFFYGEVTKFSRKKTQLRYLVVFSDTLVVAEIGLMNSLKVNKLYASGDYLISSVQDYPPFVNSVDIRQKEKSFRVNMNHDKDKIAILKAFQSVCDLHKVTDRHLENKGFAPVWIPDDQAPICMECSAKFTLFNRRHHCRSCGACICGTCFANKIVIPGLDPTPQSVCTKCFTRIKGFETEGASDPAAEADQDITKS